ncbi:MAG: EAL domain-containing protein [Campylobacterales bacterium]|nr:EAL domain-containing protein [Campylobacterales bacterium]
MVPLDRSASIEIAAYQEQLEALNTLVVELQGELQSQHQHIEILENDLLSQNNGVSIDYRMVFDASPMPMLLLDHHGIIESLNVAAVGFFELPQSQLIGRSLRSFLSRVCFTDYTLKLKHLRDSTELLQQFHHLQLRNEKPFALMLKKLSMPGGHEEKILGLISDFSSSSVQQFDYLSRVVIEQLREAVLITDNEGTILLVNNAFTEISGYSRDEALGQTPKMLKSGRHSEAYYRSMWEQIEHHGWWAGEIWNKRKNGQIYPEWLQINRITEPVTHKRYYVSTFSDITERKKHQNNLDRMAHYDTLTGLMNRSFLKISLETMLERRREEHASKLALLFLDLDHFKQINDRYGHHEGDLVLQEAGQRLLASVRNYDLVSRLGGDEFVVVIPRYDSLVQLEQIARKIINTLSMPFRFHENAHHVDASIGIALYPEHGDNVDDLMKRADTAMYRAKALGRCRMAFFDHSDERELIVKDEIKVLLRSAIDHPATKIEVHYQPIISAQTLELHSIEALVRLRDASGALVYPDLFITTAEQEGLIVALGEAIFDQVCLFVAENDALRLRQVPVAVNLSALQLCDETLMNRLNEITHRHGLGLGRFEFEVTETAAMQHLDTILSTINALTLHGCEILLDDFGTGFASLSQLHNIPVDYVKIDRSFTMQMENDERSKAMVEAMLAMSEALNLQTIVEGVETESQQKLLCQMGATYLQGYHFSRPIGKELLRERFLRSDET